jgi:hypothetical protein
MEVMRMKSAIAMWIALPALALASWLCVAPAYGADSADEVAPGLKVGQVLDQSNWQLAKDLLPPEILRHYQHGEYKNRIVDYPTGKMKWEKSFLEATEKNAGQLDVDARGTIIEKGSGKQPAYVYGIPFPLIDPKDPHAAVKIVWNQFLTYWAGGSMRNRTAVAMLTPKAVDRMIVADGWFNFVEGQDPKYRQPNPLNIQSQFLGVVLKPADLEGTASLSWRYRDASKRDSVWAFVPMLRRVRQVSPANRSDGYLGSDISGDDGFAFDGKPEDFEWKLVGKRDGLRFVDPNSISGPITITPAPGGGWSTMTDLNPPTAGFQIPDWKGVTWAPVGLALAKRTFWVVEAKPRDQYYLYGRLELWIDAETWFGAWNRKASWSGEMVANYQTTAWLNYPAGHGDDVEWIQAGTMPWACAENLKSNRATIGGMRSDPQAAYYRRVPIAASIFDSQSLQRFGK